MHVGAGKGQQYRSKAAANEPSHRINGGEATYEIVDNRLEAVQLQKLQRTADNSPQAERIGRMEAILEIAPVPAADKPRSSQNNTCTHTAACMPVQLKLVDGAQYYAVDPSGSFFTTTFKELINKIGAYNKGHGRAGLVVLRDETREMLARKDDPRRKQVLTILLDDINHELAAHQEMEAETEGGGSLQQWAASVDEKRDADQGATVNALTAMGQGKGTLTKVLDKNWFKLAIEATGHLAMGVIGVAASGAAVVGTVGVLLFQGIAGILGGIGQMAIGVSKAVRAHLMRIGKGAMLAALTGFEATVGTITSTLGAVAGWGAVGPIVSGIAGVISNIIKAVRAYFTGNEKMPKWLRGVLVVLESVFGLLGKIGSAIAGLVAQAAVAVTKFVGALIGELVLAVKGARGIKMYDDAPDK